MSETQRSTTDPRSYPVLSPEAALQRAVTVGTVLACELFHDARVCDVHGAELLTDDDFAHLATEAAHFGRIALEAVAERHCPVCGDLLTTMRARIVGECDRCATNQRLLLRLDLDGALEMGGGL